MAKEVFIGRYDIPETLERLGLSGRKLYVAGDSVPLEGYQIPFKEVIMYKHYFPWLQELGPDAVLVLNNCLKKPAFSCLEYNCIRHYCQQSGHVLVFSPLPLIQSIEDFKILRSFIAPNPFLKEFDNNYSRVHANFKISYSVEEVKLDAKVHEKYEALKAGLIAECQEKAERAVICNTDIIPRRLLRFAEKYKPAGYDRLDDFKSEMKLCVSDLKCDQHFYHELLRKKAESESLYDYIPS